MSSRVKSTIEQTTFIENGRIAFKEERILTENHRQVAQALIKFRDWRATFEAEHSTVTADDIPKPFTDLIALLANESAETLDDLAMRINSILQPFESKSNLYKAFLKAIKQIIKVTAYQERYGLADTILLSKGAPSVVPKRLIMHRWQAYDTTKFPAEIKEVIAKRRELRQSFSRLFTNAFQLLPESHRIKLLYEENGNFVGSGLPQIENRKRNIDYNPHEKVDLFCPFQEDKFTHMPPMSKNSRKRVCSSFDTLLYVGLNDSFDLKQRFLNELSPNVKRKRGVIKKSTNIDIGKLWLASTTARRDTEEDLEMYKRLASLKMKLLQFHEDVRPAYYGTWAKASSDRCVVNGRRPFAIDTQILNYDYDSEAEWDYDVDCEDIHTLEPDEDDDMLLVDSTDEEENGTIGEEYDVDDEEEVKWVVPEGYLSDDEGIQGKKKHSSMGRNHKRVTSRPVKWPISANKHFPMKSVILGPSFETTEEPVNHPLSDFRIQLLVKLEPGASGYAPFNTDKETCSLGDANASKLTSSAPITLPVYIEPIKSKPPPFQREIDKIVSSSKQELANVILENKTKTMMGLVTVIKSEKLFCEYTTAQLQAMIHDIAIQEIRGTSTEYNWYLRSQLSHPT